MRRHHRILRSFLAAVVAVATVLPSLAGIARAADISLGAPAVSIAYGTSMTFTVPVTAAVPLERVELRIRFPDSSGPYLIDVPAPQGTGPRTLQYTMDVTGGGHLVPNTRFQATWAAFAAGGVQATSAPLTVDYQDTGHAWRTVKGDLVTVHWYAGTEAFARKALAIGDKAVKDTAALLGVTETEPIDFFIYGDNASFRDALGPGTRENVGGQARSDIRTLFALITPDAINDPWVGVVIPHELVHLVFDTAVHNPYRFPPRWFNEGLAVYLSESYGPGDRSLVRDAVSSADLIPLTALTGEFPTDASKTSLAYAESVSAIDYLVRTDGRPALFALVAAYHDGLTDDEAFSRALGRDLASFQAGWLADLGADAPTRYGPQPAPVGPLPPGWSGPAQSPAPGTTPGAAPTGGEGPAESASALPGDPSAGGGSSTGTVLAAILAVVAIVIVALVLARRRAGSA